MSVLTNSITPHLQGEFIQSLVPGTLMSARKPDSRGTAFRQRPETFIRRIGAFFGERWRRLSIMNAAFEQAELTDGARSRRRSAERLLDEQAWSRLDACSRPVWPENNQNGGRGLVE
jgi:hypothetical protein